MLQSSAFDLCSSLFPGNFVVVSSSRPGAVLGRWCSFNHVGKIGGFKIWGNQKQGQILVMLSVATK